MAFTAVLGPPKVVVMGAAQILDNAYKANTEVDWKAGDFLRITSDTGELEPTDCVDSEDTGGLQAMALTDFDASEEGNVYKPILLIAEDTIFCQQVTTGTPAQTDIGSIATLDLTTGKNAPTDTTTNGVVTITDIALQGKWFMSSENICGAFGLVYFKINSAIINAARTAAT